MNFYNTMKPPPPPMLNKETTGVWSGWIRMGDREVAREAAAKGTHVDLVYTFLSQRKNMKLNDAMEWFKNEVFTWVNELLERKQIFRAKHILTNIKLDAVTELKNMFTNTDNKQQRDYIGHHLESLKELNDCALNNWFLLESVCQNIDELNNFHLESNTIDALERKSSNWKSKIAVILFLKNFDARFKYFINHDDLWEYLIQTNNAKLLIPWINVTYQSANESANCDINEELLNTFKQHSISPNMLDYLNNESSQLDSNFLSVILNELSKFGIFLESEQNNFLKVLMRICDSKNIPEIYKIITRNSSTVGLRKFYILLTNFCIENNLFSVLSSYISNESFNNIMDSFQHPKVSLLKEFHQLLSDFNEKNLLSNLFSIVSFIKNDLSYDDYFQDNYLLFMMLLLCSDVDMLDVILNKTVYILNNVDLSNVCTKLFSSCISIQTVCDKLLNKLPKNKISRYELLEKHLNIDVKQVFKFRYDDMEEIPHFNSVNLIQSYAYRKDVNYMFYIKHGRPSMATKIFILSILKECNFVNYEDFKKPAKKLHKLAYNNLENIEISNSCISMFEMFGWSSKLLRTNLKVASILESVNYDLAHIKHIFVHLDNNVHEIQGILENAIIEKIDFTTLSDGTNFIKALREYNIVVEFSLSNNIKLPEQFLRNCASNNLWLPFLIFASIKSYPIDHIKEILHCFKNPYLLQHIHHSITYDIQIDDENKLIGERDSRKYLLSKIGVRKTLDTTSIHSDRSSSSSGITGESISTASSDFLEIDILNTKTTLLQILIKCHNSTDPPKALLQACQLYSNPLLAVFATSYEPDSILTNWLTWLSVSSEMYEPFTNFEAMIVNPTTVMTLLSNVMTKRLPTTLLQSFQIFMPENPIRYLLELLCNCLSLNSNAITLNIISEKFHTALKILRRSSVAITDLDPDMTYLSNRIWIEQCCLDLVTAAIKYNLNSSYEQFLFLRRICEIELSKCFTITIPNYFNLVNIIEVLEGDENEIMDINGMLEISDNRQTIISVINKLIDKKKFACALRIAQIEELPLDLIVISKWRHKFSKKLDEDIHFWNECNEEFITYSITADRVIEFFLECTEKLSSMSDKYILLNKSYTWASKYDLTTQYELEQKLWLMYISLDEKSKASVALEIKAENCLYKDVIEKLEFIPQCQLELSKDMIQQIENLICLVLDKTNFWLALKLEKIFSCSVSDLEILKLCHRLAEGIQLPYQLGTRERILLSKVNKFRKLSSTRRTYLSTKLSSLSSVSNQSQPSPSNVPTLEPVIDSPMQDSLATIQALSEKLTYGRKIAANIMMMYKISINIDIPYQIIVANPDHVKMLKSSLEDDCSNKLEVVHDVITVYEWPKTQIADFILEEFVHAARHYVRSKLPTLTMWDLVVDQDFHLVLQLLQDNCSILGQKIYSYASTLHKAQVVADRNFKLSEITLSVELLIRAHDCFTADCNMEGISTILKKCQKVVSHLVTLQSWKLIVRLLTGVARYTEMNYVFQILRENDQFEYLLRKGSRRDNGLKIALLDYLKKFCPENRDLYKIVALHFTLFSEVALLWEREAQSIIRNLIAISRLEMQNNKIDPETELYITLTNTDGTRICLNKAMENYTHATEFHLQGERLSKAMNSARQAELLAMQLSLLKGLPSNGTAICLLNLSNLQVGYLIKSELSFEQGLMLVEAYNYQPDWAGALFDQFIIKNRIEYLDHFLNHLPLTDSLIYDITRKFISAKLDSPDEIRNMKKIINTLPSVHTKYHVASELGFTDLIEDLLDGEQLAFLKDTVWKRGYKS